MEQLALTNTKKQKFSDCIQSAKKQTPYLYLCSPGIYFPGIQHYGDIRIMYDVLMCIHYLRDLRNDYPLFVVNNDVIQIPAYCCFQEYMSRYPHSNIQSFIATQKCLEKTLKLWACNNINSSNYSHSLTFTNEFVTKLLDQENPPIRTEGYPLSTNEFETKARKDILLSLGFSSEEISKIKDIIPPPIKRAFTVKNITANHVIPQYFAVYHTCAYVEEKSKKTIEGFVSKNMIGPKSSKNPNFSLMCGCVTQSQKLVQNGFYTVYNPDNKQDLGHGINVPVEAHSYFNYYFSFPNSSSEGSQIANNYSSSNLTTTNFF